MDATMKSGGGKGVAGVIREGSGKWVDSPRVMELKLNNDSAIRVQ